MAVTHTDKKGNPIDRAPVMPGRPPQAAGVPLPQDPRETPQEEERKKRMQRAQAVNAVLSGEFRDMVVATLEASYHQDTFADLQMGALFRTHNNVMQDVLDRVATAFPSARFYLQRGGQEIEDENFKRLLSMMDYAAEGRHLDRMQLVHPGVVIHPVVVYDEETGRRHLRHLRLTPGEFDLEVSATDRSTYSEFTHYYNDPVTGVACKCEWTAKEWEVYHKAATSARGVTEWVKMDEGEHPFGCIPIVYQRLHPEKLWSDNHGKDLVDTTVGVNAAESILALLMPGQVKTLVGQVEKWPPGQNARHVGVLEAGENSSVQLVDWQLDLAAFTEEYIKRPRRTAAVRMGLPGDEWDVGVPPSGEALRMRYAERDQRAKARQPGIVKNLIKLFWLDVMTVYWNLSRPTRTENGDCIIPIDGFDGGWFKRARDAKKAGQPEPEFIPPSPTEVLPPFDPDAHWTEQEVQFGMDVDEPRYPEGRAEWEARARMRLELGLTNRGELLAEENPDLQDPLSVVRKNLALERGFKQTAVVGAPVGLPGNKAPPAEGKPVPGQQSPQPPAAKDAKDTAPQGKQDPKQPTATGAAPETEDTARKALAIQYLSLALDRLAASGQTAAEKATATKILELIKDI